MDDGSLTAGDFLGKVTVLIVTYNSAHCLKTLSEGMSGVPHLVVVDNGSRDDTCAQVREHLPSAQLIALPDNLGYGAANNVGLAHVATAYALLLNPDCLIGSGDIADLVKGAIAWPDATLFVPQLLDRSGQAQINYSWPRGTWAPRTAGAGGPLCVGYACAAVMLIRLDRLAPLGYFDPLFFLYYEDEDLCLRVFQAQGQIMVLPQVRVTHLSRGSVRGTQPWRSEYWRGYHHVQSKILFIWKHHGQVMALRLRRRALWAAALQLIARALIPSPKHLARAWGRLRGLIALPVSTPHPVRPS